MSIAVIDMGTNTFHLMIVEVEGDSFSILHSNKEAVRLGKGGISKGFITDEAGQRALKALRNFKAEICTRNVEKVFATATSAIRNAKNGDALVERIFEETGIKVRVISGDEEAETIHFGVSNAMQLGEERSLIMDIGGGSIEFVICDQDNVYWKRSFEVGGQRLLDRFHKNDRITTSELQALNVYLEDQLDPLVDAVEQLRPTTLIGSSGTFDTLSDIYLAQHKQIPRIEEATEFPLTMASFYDTYAKMIARTTAERLEIPGMIELRVEMIVVAVELIKFVLERCNIRNIRVSAYALKEGVLLKSIQGISQEKADC